MSQQAISLLELSVTALGAITVWRGVDANGNQATVQGQHILGFAREAALEAGDVIPVTVLGTAIAETGGVFNVGDRLIVDAQGRAIKNSGALDVAAGATAVTSTAANGAILTGSDLPEAVVAVALQASTAAGQFVEVLLHRS